MPTGGPTNDFFVNLLDMNTKWQQSATSEGVLDGRDRATREFKWTGTVVDLVFRSSSQLRALAGSFVVAAISMGSAVATQEPRLTTATCGQPRQCALAAAR